MKGSNYSLSGIHLPARLSLVRWLKKISFIINDINLFLAVVILFGTILHVALDRILWGFLNISPYIMLLFLLSGLTLLFSAKDFFAHQQNKYKYRRFLSIVIPIIGNGIVALIGFINIFHLDSIGNIFFDGSQITPLLGFNFYMIGLALIFPYIKFTHRFHFSQLLLFTVVMINSVSILVYMYQSLSPFIVRQNLIPANIALITTLFAAGVMMRWSNRGFFGNFTSDSFSSLFALRLLLINAAVTPVLGLIALLITKYGFSKSDIYQEMALVVVMVITMSTIAAWFNIKALYRFELEHFVMKETLRIHNIDLDIDVKDKEEKMVALEMAKQKYLEALNHEDALKNLTERLS